MKNQEDDETSPPNGNRTGGQVEINEKEGKNLDLWPPALAACQVYLAILVALSCPFYVPLGTGCCQVIPG